MKILLITYSREVNPGTFLQAFGVKLKLSELFPEAEIELIKHKRVYSFLNNSNRQNINWTFVKSKIMAIPRRIKYEILYKKYFIFSKTEFDLFSYEFGDFKLFAESYDLISVGSDTILTKLLDGSNGQFGLMWLEDIATRKIMFSASASPCNFVLNDAIKKRLYRVINNFDFISVRDNITFDLLKNKIGASQIVHELPDPTFFIPDNYFIFNNRKLSKIAKYKKIALVNFGDKFKFKSNLTAYLKANSYYVISTHFNSYADKNFMNLNPFQWGGLFSKIDLVVSDRFHDTVFGLRNNKIVFTLEWDDNRFSGHGKSKARDLLQKYSFESQHFIIENEVDYIRFIDFFERFETKGIDAYDFNLQQASMLNEVNFDLL